MTNLYIVLMKEGDKVLFVASINYIYRLVLIINFVQNEITKLVLIRPIFRTGKPVRCLDGTNKHLFYIDGSTP